MLAADDGSHAHSLGSVAACGHDARGSESNMRCTDDPAGQEKIADIPAVKRPERYLVNSLRVPLRTGREFAVNTIGGMQIHSPATEGNGVLVNALFYHITLRKNIVTFKSTALAFSGNASHPFQREVFRLGKPPGILDVVPDSIGDPPEFPLDFFGLMNSVAAAAPLKPPETAAGIRNTDVSITRYFSDITQSEIGRDVSDGTASVLAVEVERVSE